MRAHLRRDGLGGLGVAIGDRQDDGLDRRAEPQRELPAKRSMRIPMKRSKAPIRAVWIITAALASSAPM